MSADKLASFRVDSELWQQFQAIAKNNGTNASALLVTYIKEVVNTENVNTNQETVNTTTEIKKSNVSIQDIDDCIDKSVNDGKIKQAITTVYENMMGNFNQLLSEVNELKNQLSVKSQELALNSSATISENDSKFIEQTYISILGIENIINGDNYNKDSIGDIRDKMIEHQWRLEQDLNIKLSLNNPSFIVRELNKVLRALGFELESKQVGKMVNYWIKTPTIGTAKNP